MKTFCLFAVPVTCCTGSPSQPDRKSTRLNSSHLVISYAVFCLKKKKNRLSLHDHRRCRQAIHLRGPGGTQPSSGDGSRPGPLLHDLARHSQMTVVRSL